MRWPLVVLYTMLWNACFLDMKEQKGVFPDKEHIIGAFNSALYSEASCFFTGAV